jgi:hypothetical protein
MPPVDAIAPWEQLFPPDAHAAPRPARLARKHGDALLLLPFAPALARRALTLYPAQSPKARLARALLAFAPRLGTEAVTLRPNPASAFARFLAECAGTPALPHFALLLGNPRAPGRRFVILTFDDGGAPAALVKAGVGEAASQLIAAESTFLKSQPATRLAAPALRAEFSAADTRAVAMEFVPGSAPRADAAVGELLTRWLQPAGAVNFLELPAAGRLSAAAGVDPHWRRAARALQAVRICAAIHHGDFAPWNVRVAPDGQWCVLDWERGEAAGPPAWDWFHWLIQPEVLVRRTPVDTLVRRLEVRLAASDFQRYAAAAGITEVVRPLLLAYLLHCRHVTRQVDGLAAVEALTTRVAASIPTGT